MAEKILQTRIINKHAELETWKLSTLPLKEGEIALAKVMVAQPDGTQAPTYVAKIGLEGKTFSESPMLFAPASDVYEWAKASVKPSYNAGEIARGTSTTAGTVAGDLKAAEEAIIALQAAVGEGGSVVDAIKAAIEALDVEDTAVANQFVTAVAETDGKISVTRRALDAADIPALGIDKITGLQDKLDLKANAADVEQTTNAITARLDSGDIHTSIVNAQKAGDDAQKTVDDYITSNDAALAGVKATAEAATTVDEATNIANTAVSNFNTNTIVPLAEKVTTLESDLEDEIERATGVEEGLDGRLTTVEGKVNALSSATHFLGVKDALPAEAAKGDIVIVGNKEYVYDPEATVVVEGTHWVELGDTTAELAEISGIKERIDEIESDLSADGDTTKAIEAAQNAADAAQASADAIYKVSGDTATGVLAEEIARATKAEADNLAEAKKYAEDEADAAQSAAEGTAKSYTDAEIEKVVQTANDLAATVAQNKTDAAAATKQVADDLAAYEEANDAAVDVVRQNAQKGVDDAASALAYAKGLEEGIIKTNTQNIANNAAAISNIEDNYARVKDNQLVYGQGEAEMTIIFDCGGAE